MISAKVWKCDNFISKNGNACTWLTCIFGTGADEEICKVFVSGSYEYKKGDTVNFIVKAGQNMLPQLRLVK